MTNEQLIAKFNPANGANLTAEDLEILRNLTDAQIDVLAEAYPNQPTRRAYLRLYDKSLAADKQIYQPTTWQNLRNLRKFNAKKNLIPWDFFLGAAKFNEANKKAPLKTGAVSSAKKVTVDISAKEAAAELAATLGNVNNDSKADKAKAPVKSIKTATSAKKNGKNKAESLADSLVDNSSVPDDQQFASIQDN